MSSHVVAIRGVCRAGSRDTPVSLTEPLENDDDPPVIAGTRQYLRDFNRLNEATMNARQA
jgi:hypothetical protein